MKNSDTDSESSDMDIDEEYNNTVTSTYVYEPGIFSYERQHEMYINHRNNYEINVIMNEMISAIIQNVTENNSRENIIMI